MTKIMILNGPPRCGKDTAANAVEDYFGDDVCKHLKLSQPLKDIAQAVLGYDEQTLEDNKDKVLTDNNTSYRDAQIHTFSQLCPVFGDDWLGKHLINRIVKMDQPYFVLSDGGRTDDLLPLLRQFHPDDLMIVQIMREGCNFVGDVRSYIASPNVRTRPTINNDINVFKAEMIAFAGEFFAD